MAGAPRKASRDTPVATAENAIDVEALVLGRFETDSHLPRWDLRRTRAALAALKLPEERARPRQRLLLSPSAAVRAGAAIDALNAHDERTARAVLARLIEEGSPAPLVLDWAFARRGDKRAMDALALQLRGQHASHAYGGYRLEAVVLLAHALQSAGLDECGQAMLHSSAAEHHLPCRALDHPSDHWIDVWNEHRDDLTLVDRWPALIPLHGG